MVSASEFYRLSSLNRTRATSPLALSHVESVNLPKTIVILPPESAFSNQDSNIEGVPDQLQEVNLKFEPAGCLEI